MKETGIRRTEDGGVYCEACGNDLSQARAAKYVAHMDGTTFYTDCFECAKCGAPLSQTHERSNEDAALWGE